MAGQKTMDEIYQSALNGDIGAECAILDFYEPYLIHMSRVPYYNVNGDIRYYINEELYMSLKLKLHSMILEMTILG